MKRSLSVIIAVLLLCLPVMAANVNLAWDASSSPDVAGYAIFARDYTHGYTATPAWEGVGLTCTVAVPDDRQTAFVAKAWAWGPYDLNGNREKIWSGPSNEVVYVPSVTQPPPPPANFLQKLLSAVIDFFDGWRA
jgi:hypothetical protein